MNSGARLLNIYNKLVQTPQDSGMVQVWARVFDLHSVGSEVEDAVALLVLGLRAELTFARSRLASHGVPVELTSPAFERLSSVASAGQLHSRWSSHNGNISSPECRKIFEWADWALREEGEADISAEEMQTLRAELDALEAALGEAGMAPYLRQFIERQIKTIRDALRMYGIRGVEPIREALQQVAGAYKTDDKRLSQAFGSASEPQRSLFSRATGAIKKVADVADTITKLKAGAEDITAIGNSIVEVAKPYITPLLEN